MEMRTHILKKLQGNNTISRNFALMPFMDIYLAVQLTTL